VVSGLPLASPVRRPQDRFCRSFPVKAFHAPDRWSTFKVLVKPGPDREVGYLRSVTLG
jgi:hypothetical protein